MATFVQKSWTAFRRATGLDEISLGGLTEEAANRLRRAQIRGAIEQMRVFTLGNTVFAPVMAFQAWGIGMNGLVIAWTCIMLAFSWWHFWSWGKTYHTDGRAEDMAKFIRETRVSTLIWCSGMAFFYPFVAAEPKTVMLSVMVGSLALGTIGYAPAPRAAFWYLAAHAVVLIPVPLITGVWHGSGHDKLLGALAFVAVAGIFNAVLEAAKQQMRTFLLNEDLVHKTEVVDLLLKDYEEQGAEWIWRTDASGALVSCPHPILELLGVEDLEAAPVSLVEALARAVGADGEKDVTKLHEAFAAQVDLHGVTLPLCHPETGKTRWIVVKGRPQFENARFAGFRGIFADNTATVEAKNHIAFLAEHDPLTGLYNRNFVQSTLEALNPEEERVLVFLVDLDGFKQVNDGYGHATGDALLKAVATRLSAAVREATGAAGIVARLGGDEFFIFCRVKPGEMGFVHKQLGRRFLQVLEQPFTIAHLEINLTGSVGIATFPKDTRHGPTLLKHADLALYAAKRGGRNRAVEFAPDIMDGLQNRIVVTERLRKAVQAGEVETYYQPQFYARSLRMTGAEALARWSDAELGRIVPDVFIPIAEETGLIHELSEQLLRRACQDALTWAPREDGTPLMLSVNLSPVEVKRGAVAKTIARVLNETGFPPERLEVEITEGVLIDDVLSTRRLLQTLSDTGIQIALDDFGTGYSSLSYVRALPLDRLKIDRSFVLEIEEEEAQSIVAAIVSLCDRLGLKVVAEGVETDRAVSLLRQLGCDSLQGYHFSPPLPAADFLDMTQGRARAATG